MSNVQPQEAEGNRHLQQAIDAWERLVEEYPKVAEYRMDLAQAHTKMACRLESSAADQSRRLHQRAIKLRERLSEEKPGSRRGDSYLADLATAHADFGNSLDRAGAAKEAVPHLEEAIRLMEQVVARSPNAIGFRQQLAELLNGLAGSLGKRGRTADGLKPQEKATRIRQELARECPTVPGIQMDLAGSECNLGLFLIDEDREEEAIACFRRAEARLVAALKVTGPHSGGERFLRNVHYAWAHALGRLGRMDEALPHLRASGHAGKHDEEEFRETMAEDAAIQARKRQRTSSRGRPSPSPEKNDKLKSRDPPN